MFYVSALFPESFLWIANLALLWCLWQVLHHIDWRRMRDHDDRNAWLIMVVAVFLLWTVRAGIGEGLGLHLLGATLLTLMFGWAYAILALFLVVLMTGFLIPDAWLSLGVNTWLLVILPVSFSHVLYRLVDRYLPNHFFIYIFLNAFFGAALTISLVVLGSALMLYLFSVYDAAYLQYNFLRYLLLLLFPEAFVTGMLMTLLVVFRPQWVATFDDRRYLTNR